MAIYVDQYLILDTASLVCAHLVHGQHEYDGCYAIALLLQSGEQVKRAYADYGSAEERNTAFVALGRLLRAEDADIVALEDD